MELFKRHHFGVLTACILAIAISVAVAAEYTQEASKKWPPLFPREGATKLFENEKIIVWEQIGRPKEPFIHKHVRDTLMISLQDGRVETINVDGTKSDGSAESRSVKRIHPGNGGIGSLIYITAGLGPHAEVTADPNHIPKSIFIELKGTEPKDCTQWSTVCQQTARTGLKN